jgi:acetyl-CoA carboxylase biotin carboxyl carrier protein
MPQPSVEEIIGLLREFPVSEIKIESEGYRVSAVSGPHTYQPPVAEVLDEPAPAVGTEPQVQEEKPALFVTATMVGHFHLPSPALKFGDEIKAGQYVGNIESIKVMNDVLAQVDGSLVETVIEDGAPVEYGQPLYRLN